MYLYNWVSMGQPTAADEWFSIELLASFTEHSNFEKLENVWSYFQDNLEELNFDGSNELNADQVMYLYNFVSLGCPSPDEAWFNAEMLGAFVEAPNQNKLDTAMETLQDMAQQ